MVKETSLIVIATKIHKEGVHILNPFKSMD